MMGVRTGDKVRPRLASAFLSDVAFARSGYVLVDRE